MTLATWSVNPGLARLGEPAVTSPHEREPPLAGLDRLSQAPSDLATPEPTSPGVSVARTTGISTETNLETRRRVFSGVQPTGNMHIGNYLGAFRNWVDLQGGYDTIYCIVDLHALTVPIDPQVLYAQRLDAAKVLMAVGVDHTRSLFYAQSQVPQHAELSWILSTMTPTGVLNRMTQYKDKVDQGAGANLGLFAYPVLMAADILLHRANLVPVGDDQRQHLEMTRDLAERFNNRFGEVFPIPDALIPETSARVMSLTEPTMKMSKSDPNPRSRILIVDPADEIRAKVKSAVTDSEPTVRHDWDDKPGISNLLEIMSGCTGRSVAYLVDEYSSGGYGRFKEAVAEAVAATLAPVRAAYRELEDAEVARIMQKGALDARTQAERHQQDVRRAVGLDRV
jgi:tryptophanyl-tRNA synthetase